MKKILDLAVMPTMLLVGAKGANIKKLEIHESQTRASHLLSAVREMLRDDVPGAYILYFINAVEDVADQMPVENKSDFWLPVERDWIEQLKFEDLEKDSKNLGFLMHRAEKLLALYRQGESKSFHKEMEAFETAFINLLPSMAQSGDQQNAMVETWSKNYVEQSEPKSSGNYSLRVERINWDNLKDFEVQAEGKSLRAGIWEKGNSAIPQPANHHFAQPDYPPGTAGLRFKQQCDLEQKHAGEMRQNLNSVFELYCCEIDVLKHTLDRINPNWLNKTDEYYSGVKVSLPIRAALLYIEAAENYFGSGGKAVEPSLIFNPSIPFSSWTYAETADTARFREKMKTENPNFYNTGAKLENYEIKPPQEPEGRIYRATAQVSEPKTAEACKDVPGYERSSILEPDSNVLTPLGAVYFAARKAADQYARTGCSPEAFRESMENLIKTVYQVDVPKELSTAGAATGDQQYTLDHESPLFRPNLTDSPKITHTPHSIGSDQPKAMSATSGR